jgi:tetratricopeptide (TPR) repeat protein
MEISATQCKSEVQLPIEAAHERTQALYAQGRHQEALDICLHIARTYPGVVGAWSDAAINCAMLKRWQDAVNYGQTALAHGENSLEVYDALVHAYVALGRKDEARRYGLQALKMRAERFGGNPVIPLPQPGPMPPLPSAQTRERNSIAFSLFGENSKYCESAILNVQEQPSIYPYWVCRFYVDGSVPESVIERLRASGAQIVPVRGPALQWPGPMWRFLALNDGQAHRILFRDADSLILQREAAAVAQWLVSDKRFHVMRDWGSHTELMLAGLWGVVAGSLPPLEKLMERFINVPLQSRHFADQYFLRQYVWPYAHTSLMQHDSVFGFMDALPFPGEKAPDEYNVGYCECALSFTMKTDFPDELEVIWELYQVKRNDDGKAYEQLVCAYSSTVKNGAISAHIPTRYVRWLQQGTARIGLRTNKVV